MLQCFSICLRDKTFKKTLDALLLNKEINQTFVYIFVDKFLDLKDKESYFE